MRISEKDKLDIINAFETLERVTSIASRHGVTRGRVYQVLKTAGIDTSKRRLPVSCTVCQAVIMRTKAHIRKTHNHFCGTDCYHAFIENKKSKYWRQGQRIARKAVSTVFDLQPGHTVHHIDTNNYNNNLDNLAVFATQGDHIRFHRGFDVSPIWPIKAI